MSYFLWWKIFYSSLNFIRILDSVLRLLHFKVRTLKRLFYTVGRREEFWVAKLKDRLDRNLRVGDSPRLRIYDVGQKDKLEKMT